MTGQADPAKELLDSLEDDAKADPQIASLATMVKLAASRRLCCKTGRIPGGCGRRRQQS